MRDCGRNSACGGSDKGEGVASGDDEDGLRAERGVNERHAPRRARFIRCRNSNHGPRLAPCVLPYRNNSGFLW